MMKGQPLFHDGDLSHYLRGETQEIEAYVRKKLGEGDLAKSDEEIVADLLPGARVGAIEVNFDDPVRNVAEAQVEVADQFRGGRIKVAGIRVTKAFPYKGQQLLFKLQPNSYTARLPYADVTRTHVVLIYEGRSDEEAVKREIAEMEGILKFYVDASYRQVETHDASIPALLMDAVKRRRAHLGEVSKIKDF